MDRLLVAQRPSSGSAPPSMRSSIRRCARIRRLPTRHRRAPRSAPDRAPARRFEALAAPKDSP
eukprot:1414073-Pyramimonas_sp.AAC.1